MARKQRGKSTDTDLKAQQALEAVLSNPDKTRQKIAEELGVDRRTVTERVKRAMTPETVQTIISRSRDRLIQMLSRCDDAYLRVLKYNHPDNFGNQIRVATSMYKTFGLIDDEAQIKVQNIIPIQVVIQDPNGERAYTIGPAQAAPQTGQSIRNDE